MENLMIGTEHLSEMKQASGLLHEMESIRAKLPQHYNGFEILPKPKSSAGVVKFTNGVKSAVRNGYIHDTEYIHLNSYGNVVGRSYNSIGTDFLIAAKIMEVVYQFGTKLMGIDWAAQKMRRTKEIARIDNIFICIVAGIVVIGMLLSRLGAGVSVLPFISMLIGPAIGFYSLFRNHMKQRVLRKNDARYSDCVQEFLSIPVVARIPETHYYSDWFDQTIRQLEAA